MSMLVSRHTGLFFKQILFLMIIPQLGGFDLCGHLRVDVVTVADVVHPAATTWDDTLNLLSLVDLRWLVPVYRHRRDNFNILKIEVNQSPSTAVPFAYLGNYFHSAEAVWSESDSSHQKQVCGMRMCHLPVVVLTIPPTAWPLSISSSTESRLRCLCSSMFFTWTH